jgi:hypothetical protein
VLVIGASSIARANGRFPRAERLVEDPDNPNHLILAATYGLMVTGDRGRNWYYVCEASFSGQPQYVGDPLVDLSGGAMVVDVQSSITVSRDDGCSWSTALGGPGTYVPDFTVARASSNVLAVFAANEDGGVGVHLAESSDGGRSFRVTGTPLPIGVAFTIDVAPSDPGRIYVSALTKANAPVLVVSTDHGSTWTSLEIAIGKDELPYIAAIDPVDAQKIYLRTAATNKETSMSDDALFVSADGGGTWREVFRAAAEMLGFALSPDGATVLLGYGDAMDPDLLADPSVLGLYRAATSDFAFSRASTTSTTCLSWTQSGVYACTSQFDTGYAVAFAPASSGPDVARLAPLLDLGDVRGPACCGGSPGICAESWSSTCATFGACDGGAAPGGAEACSSDAGPTADAGSIADGSAARDDGRSQNEGCACRAGARPDAGAGGWAACMVAAFTAIFRSFRLMAAGRKRS